MTSPTIWQHQRLDISATPDVGAGAASNIEADHTILIAKLVITAMSEYHCSWTLNKHFATVASVADMVAEESTRNLLSWKTVGSGDGPQCYGSMFQFEWNIGLVLPIEYDLGFIVRQEATNDGGILGTCFVTYTEVE